MDNKINRKNYFRNKADALKKNIQKRKQFQNKYYKNLKKNDSTIR